jgi:hypothetical protein
MATSEPARLPTTLLWATVGALTAGAAYLAYVNYAMPSPRSRIKGGILLSPGRSRCSRRAENDGGEARQVSFASGEQIEESVLFDEDMSSSSISDARRRREPSREPGPGSS